MIAMDTIEALSTAELHALAQSVQSELAKRAGEQPSKGRVSIKFSGYNSRRYSKPWICRVTEWPVGGKPLVEWGTYNGDDQGGEVEIEAHPGAVIRYGQRDHRGNGTLCQYAIVQGDWTIKDCDAPEARKRWLDSHPA